jgi:hypothetical protein
MATKLKLLLEKIDYQNLFEADERRVERILAEYRSERNTIDDYDEFKKCLIDFVSRIYGAIVNSPNAFENADDLFMHGLALKFLNTKYPGNTERTVYEIMHSGAEGGVYQILKSLAEVMMDKIYKDGVDHYIALFMEEITFEERAAAVNEYLSEYGDKLPTNYKNDPNMVMIAFDKVLYEHAIMMRRLRRI